jgi:hypothetical protein
MVFKYYLATTDIKRNNKSVAVFYPVQQFKEEDLSDFE